MSDNPWEWSDELDEQMQSMARGCRGMIILLVLVVLVFGMTILGWWLRG